MALKPDRKILDGTDISFFMNTTAEKGSVVILSAGGSGAAMDDSAAVAALASQAYGSGQYPLGILLCDVVSGDLTKTHLNYQKDEVQVGSKVVVCRRGVVTTNMIDAATNPTAGQAAYIGATATDGKLTALAWNAGNQLFVGTGNAAAYNTTGLLPAHWTVGPHNPAFTRVGTWLSSKDSDGYAKLDVNLI